MWWMFGVRKNWEIGSRGMYGTGQGMPYKVDYITVLEFPVKLSSMSE